MPSLLVRNLDASIVTALKARAIANHRSAEAEHRAILAEVLMQPQHKTFAERLSSFNAEFECLIDDETVPESI